MQRKILTWRSWLGIAIAPFAGAVMYEALILIDPASGKVFTNKELVAGFIFILLPTSYILCIAFGAPLVYLLQKKNLLTCRLLVGAAGALSASAICLLLFVSFLLSDANLAQFDWKSLKSVFLFLGGAGIFGAIVAGVFCMVSGITCRSIGRAETTRR